MGAVRRSVYRAGEGRDSIAQLLFSEVELGDFPHLGSRGDRVIMLAATAESAAYGEKQLNLFQLAIPSVWPDTRALQS